MECALDNEQTASTPELAGSCLCGAVRYSVADEFRYAFNCHCSLCRRTTGSAFKPIAGIEFAKFAVSNGDDKLLIYGDPTGHDAHCNICGSLLYSVVREGAFIRVPMGTPIDQPTIRPSAHIFVASRCGKLSLPPFSLSSENE